MNATWARWLPGKWHEVEQAPEWARRRSDAITVVTLCGRPMREPDRLSITEPLDRRCPACERERAARRAA